MTALRFLLNDRWCDVTGLPPTTTLLRYLRDHARLTGTKEGCAEGDCGACTVAVLERSLEGAPVWRAQNACLLLLPMLHGKRVYTVEGISSNGALHPAQRALVEKLGSQCGYCTPGIVMSMFEGVYRADLDEPSKLDAQLCGNLCRCTGYRPIREAAHAVCGTRPDDRFRAQLDEPLPPRAAFAYACGPQRFAAPETFEALWELLEQKDARVVNGGTDLGLEITKRYAEPELLVSLEALEPLTKLEVADARLVIGAGVRLTDLEPLARAHHAPLARMLRDFGSRQIRSRATVGGNLCTASAIGDLAPVLLACGAALVARSRAGERRIAAEDFFTGYRKTALRPDEVLAHVELPRPGVSTRTAAYKVSKRREVDISTVCAAFWVELDSSARVSAARLAFGGVAATPIRARAAEAALVGTPFDEAAIERAAHALGSELAPLTDHRGSADYRRLVSQNLLRGFWHEQHAPPSP